MELRAKKAGLSGAREGEGEGGGPMRGGEKVVVAGHVCVDITPVFPERAHGLADEALLAPGRLLHMRGVNVSPGGAVANTGLALRLMGADALLMGKVGDDALGGLLLGILEKHGARDGMIVSGDAATSFTVVIAPPGVDRMFLHDPGANDAFSFDDLDIGAIREARLFHFGYPPLMRRMYRDGGAELARMFRAVKGMGVATSLDMADVDPASEAGRADWGGILAATLPHVDVFAPSAEELCYMLDRDLYERWRREAAADGGEGAGWAGPPIRDVARLAGAAAALGAKVVLVKCGAAGFYYRTAPAAGMAGFCAALGLAPESWGGREGFEPSYVPDRVASATGAGDTCIAAFLASALRGYGLAESLRLAAAQGACCVSEHDALGGLLTLEALDEKIRSGWVKRPARQFN
jgi:sugar/nucleoside kinase (ribokinase family)